MTYLAWTARNLTWDAGLILSDLLPANAFNMVGVNSYSIRAHHVRFVVEQVEDWSHVRCVARPAHTWCVVRAFDVRSGIEVSRGALDDAGYHHESLTPAPDRPLPPWPSAATVARTLARELGVTMGAATLVRSWGLCTQATVPCVAAEAADGSAIFFTQGGQTFRVSLLEGSLTQSPPRRLAPGQRFFSLGPRTYGVGEPLTPP
ncbi:MAG: hypothetical protein ABI609_12865 [Acidobacteriota bacterium]